MYAIVLHCTHTLTDVAHTIFGWRRVGMRGLGAYYLFLDWSELELGKGKVRSAAGGKWIFQAEAVHILKHPSQRLKHLQLAGNWIRSIRTATDAAAADAGACFCVCAMTSRTSDVINRHCGITCYIASVQSSPECYTWCSELALQPTKTSEPAHFLFN